MKRNLVSAVDEMMLLVSGADRPRAGTAER